MQIDERILGDGQVVVTTLARVGELVELRDGAERVGRLPVLAIERVFARFARELDPDLSFVELGSLDLGPAGVLRHLRFHAIVDAEARDYLVLAAPGAPPVAALATTIAAALRHLALAARAAANPSGG